MMHGLPFEGSTVGLKLICKPYNYVILVHNIAFSYALALVLFSWTFKVRVTSANMF